MVNVVHLKFMSEVLKEFGRLAEQARDLNRRGLKAEAKEKALEALSLLERVLTLTDDFPRVRGFITKCIDSLRFLAGELKIDLETFDLDELEVIDVHIGGRPRAPRGPLLPDLELEALIADIEALELPLGRRRLTGKKKARRASRDDDYFEEDPADFWPPKAMRRLSRRSRKVSKGHRG